MRLPGHLSKLAVVFSAAALVAAGCGGSGSGSNASSPGAQTNPSAQSSASPSSSIPDDAQLKGALLTASEVGQGFTVDTSSPDDSGGASGCAALSQILNRDESQPPGSHKAEIAFQNDNQDNQVYIAEDLLSEPSPQFQTDYVQYKNALTNCRKLTIPIDANTKLDLQVSDENFAPNTTGARLDGTIEGTPVNGYLVLARPKPNVAMLFFLFQLNSGDSQFAFTLFQQAQQKAQTQLPG
jgi:hypothetical protein